LKMNDSKTEYTTTIGQIILQSYCSWWKEYFSLSNC
jgi:hypothetical protein